MLSHSIYSLFYVDRLALCMIFLVGFIGGIVTLFSIRYMQGDHQYKRFLFRLVLLICSVMIMVSSDNIFLMLAAWAMSNSLLIMLMIHKPQWRAALYSGLYTLKAFAIGFVSLASAFLILFWQTKETSIQSILQQINHGSLYCIVAVMLILITVMTQSAIWPFHRWLLSSLNSPTPVSAIMHAGLVNGGGYLLARFSPILVSNQTIMLLIFSFGIITACLGSLWKLIQHDIKRMLACSTMGQMGYMLVQCGIGMFPAAIAHLCWHGMFKANLFLSSNSAVNEKRYNVDDQLTWRIFIYASLSGVIASYFFSAAIHTSWYVDNTKFILIVISFMTATQFSLSLLISSSLRKLPLIIAISSLMSYLYGSSVYLMEYIFNSSDLIQPQPLNIIHVLGVSILSLMWVAINFKKKLLNLKNVNLLDIVYMKSLNSSQPYPLTITSHRNHYRF